MHGPQHQWVLRFHFSAVIWSHGCGGVRRQLGWRSDEVACALALIAFQRTTELATAYPIGHLKLQAILWKTVHACLVAVNNRFGVAQLGFELA